MTIPDHIAYQEAEYAAAATEALAAPVGETRSPPSTLGTLMVREFAQAMNDRLLTEQRWLKDLRQYRGQYSPDELAAIGPNRSTSFVRKTRVKVKTVDARIVDLLFPSGKEQNFSIGPTPNPSIAPEQRQTLVNALAKALGRSPTEQELDAALQKQIAQASAGMARTIEDQLSECRYKQVAKQVIHSGNLYGTGILKAPLVERKIRERFIQKNGRWQVVTEQYTVPFIDFVPIWRFYPDMSATELEDCRYVYERHLMTRAGMRKLAQRKSFNRKAINAYVKANPNGYMTLRTTDAELKIIGERHATQHQNNGLYEVLERWGWLSADELRDAGVKVPPSREDEEFFCNTWALPTGEVIRAVIQPINGVTWPYHLYHFDKDETSIFAEGLASILRDDQTIINAVTRMILDNAALTAGPMLEVDVGLLSRSEKADQMFPFKIWPRNGTERGTQAVRVIELPGNLEELSALYGMFDTNADEISVVPRYAAGENPTRGAASTASGMSMLMSAQGVAVKDLVSAYDEGITKPFISALYRWNMQFSKDDSIKGDFDVVALGTASMIAKEVRAQQLNQFSATLTPDDAPFIKRFQLISQRAEAHDLTDIVKTEDEVDADNNSEQAKRLAQMQEMQAQLQMASLQGQVQKLGAEVQRINAEALRVHADALAKKMSAAYAAMEAAGIAVTNPSVAAAGDSLLADAGWQSATEEIARAAQPLPPGQEQLQPSPVPPMREPPAGAGTVGMMAGSETPGIGHE